MALIRSSFITRKCEGPPSRHWSRRGCCV